MTNSLICKWARLDSNQGPKDYESFGNRQAVDFSESTVCQRVPGCDQARHNGVTAAAQWPIAKFPQCAAGNRPPRRSRSIHGGQYTDKRSRRVLRVPALALALLAGCASAPSADLPIVTARHELSLPELVSVCNKGATDHEPDLLGCFEWIGGTCHIYTLPRWVRETRDGDLSGYHRTLGHELDHCQRGSFHGEDKGVRLPRLPRLP